MPIEIEWKKDGETFDPPTDIQVNPLLSPRGLYCITDRQHCVTGITAARDRIIPSCHQVQNNVFSSNILFFSLRASHSGSYTCIATNKAAAVNFTAQLIVRGAFFLFSFSQLHFFICSPRCRVLMGFPAVSPKWELEPQDLTILHKVQFSHSQISRHNIS